MRTEAEEGVQYRMKREVIRSLVLLALTLGIVACGERTTPSPAAVATESDPAPLPTLVPPEPTAPEPEPTLPVEPTPRQQPTPAALVRFEGAPCPFDLPANRAVVCGFVVVPEDHSDPDGPTIRLAAAVFKDQSDDHQPDPVLLLTGGPGERTVHLAPPLAQLLADIHPNRDLVIFDQRGVGLSQPALECPEFVAAVFDLLGEADPDLALRTTFDAVMACRDRLVAEGYNLSAYNTAQNAADVDAIRDALGYDQVNLYGGSYGSLLAQATMRDYPEHIRSVAINSVWPLEKSFAIDVSTVAADAVLRLLDACAGDEGCSSAYPDLQPRLFALIDQLNDDPLAISVTNPLDGQAYDAVLTGDAVFGNLVVFLYQTQVIPAVPQAIDDVTNGDYDLMALLVGRNLALFDALSRGMEYSVLCAEDLVGRTPADLLDVRSALPPQLAGRADPELQIEYGLFGICENWPVEQAEARVKEPLVSDIPTLVLEGQFDPVTPPEYGRLVAENLSNSYFFEFPGVGHDVLANGCARSIIGAFVNDPTQAPDAACFGEMPGVVFDLPREPEKVVMEPFTDEQRGFSGLVPTGWNELAPANLARGDSALDPTYFVLEGTPGTAAELFVSLAGQLGLDPEL